MQSRKNGKNFRKTLEISTKCQKSFLAKGKFLLKMESYFHAVIDFDCQRW